ncbi:MAG: methyltransferase domain-containing protein [Rhodospirillaceae bacterium]|jgi:SAM-dependent methyltransferase|nr:methyltransferase domain-containing protein [Rhodospirillaceae bacterium]MBT4587743.1 methyltransferase domain-containing protein [Rhodospirillaceae bacterium]MBT7266775.1 methyltransferase domain-containing protein [Rhodospirillaceae bacterium]
MSSGFDIDTPYTWGYYNELSPIYLNFVCALNGHHPIPLDDGFSYCELGCGYGVTTNGLAELFPQGDFIGIDYNDDHIDAANEMAEEIGSLNVDFKSLDFNEISKADLPQFDFIVLHGVYSWVDPNTREAIRKFIAAHLKEDGIAYVSYDCMPGWAAIAPLRDIVLTHTAGMTTSSQMKAQAGLDYLDFMANNNASFFVDNPPAKEFLNEIKGRDIDYVTHELLVDFAKPYYFHQVAAEMRSAGLSYSGSAILNLNLIDLAVPAEFHEILQNASSRNEFESRGDFIRNQRFRKDVFKNSRKTMDVEEQLEVLSHVVFGVTCAVPEFKTSVAFGDVSLNYAGDVFSSLIDVLSVSAKSAASLSEMDQFKEYPLELIVDALKFLSAGKQVVPMRADAEGRTDLDLDADRYTIPAAFNIQFLKRRLLKQSEMVLLAPRAGVGIEMSMADALFALCMVEATRDEVAPWVFQRLVEAKQEIIFAGGTEQEAIAEAVEKFRETRLPKFLELGILEPAQD